MENLVRVTILIGLLIEIVLSQSFEIEAFLPVSARRKASEKVNRRQSLESTDVCTFDQKTNNNHRKTVQRQTTRLPTVFPMTPRTSTPSTLRPTGNNGLACSIWSMKSSRWMLSRSSDAYFLGGPPIDAQNSTTGNYALFDKSSIVAGNQIGRLYSVVSPPTGPKGLCFSFSYSKRGLGVASFRVRLLYENNSLPESNASRILWQTNDNTEPDYWSEASISFTAESPFRIALEGVVTDENIGADFRGYVAVDNTKFTSGFCRGHCNFDLDTCLWTNTNVSDDFDWSMGWGSSNSGTGPLRGYSAAPTEGDKGGYLFINSDYPRRTGDRARLISPILPPSMEKPFCLKFWVSEFGIGIGNLTVAVLKENTNQPEVIWTLSDPLGGGFLRENWYPVQMTVSGVDEYRVIIEGTIGLPGKGNIAIDNISIENGACAPLPATAKVRSGECAFVDDRCQWKTKSIRQATGSPELWSFLPSGDQSTQPEGHTALPSTMIDGYMKFETNHFQHNPLDRSRLVSPRISSTKDPVCLSFWIYMSSPVTTKSGLGALQVLILNSSANTADSQATAIWRLENHQESRWIYSQVAILSTGSYQIAFEGIRGAQVLGLIAVDDVAFFSLASKTNDSFFAAPGNNLRPNPSNKRQITQRPFLLSSSTILVPTRKITPRTVPGSFTTLPSVASSDVSLASRCKTLPYRASVLPGDCSFESNLCQWLPSPKDSGDLRWQLANPSKAPSNVRDHTFNIPQAGFIFYDPFTPSGNPATTTLESPPMFSALCMTFWYMIYGNDVSVALSVSQHPLASEIKNEVWKTSEATRTPRWRFAQVAVGLELNETFRVVIMSSARLATMTIDDVRFYPLEDNESCRKKS